MTNKWIKYYSEKGISPVKQDISDMKKHLAKREKLYRQLGIPSLFFEGKKILEVGPGSGYNTLAFFAWGGEHVTLVEPNKVGADDMVRLFRDMNIDSNKYTLVEDTIEHFVLQETYDIVVAEGFIHACDNAKEIIGILERYVRPGGVIVITCMDFEGMFVEQMQRLVFQREVRNISDYNEKVTYIATTIKKYDKLEGRSRSIEDWVRDDILNPTFNNENILSFDKAVDCFSDKFAYLGSSQSIFTDYSWYKDLDSDEKSEIKSQMRRKRHNFLMTGVDECVISEEDADSLYIRICEIRKEAIKYEEDLDNNRIENVVNLLKDIIPILGKVNEKIRKFAECCIAILVDGLDNSSEKEIFLSATGRTQQYFAMMKSRYCKRAGKID